MNYTELRQEELQRERAPDVAEILRLTEENKKLRQAAKMIHRRGWTVSGSLEMAEIDLFCKDLGLDVWTWKLG